MPQIPKPDDEERRRRRIAEEAKIAANMEADRARNLARLETAKRLESFNPPMLGAAPVRSGARYEEPDLTAGSPEPERRYIPPVDDPMRDAPGIAQSPAWDSSLSIPASQDGSGIFGVGSGGPLQEVDGVEGIGTEEAPTELTPDKVVQIQKWYAEKEAARKAGRDATRLLEGGNPDEAAQALDLSQRTGATRLEVQQDIPTYSRLDRLQALQDLQSDAPRLYQWMDGARDNFDIAHDDTENLGWWESLNKSFGDAFARTDALKAERGSRDGAGMGALTDIPLRSDTLRPQTDVNWSPVVGTPSWEEFGAALKVGTVEGSQEQFFGASEMGIGIARMFEWLPGVKGLLDAGEKEAQAQRIQAVIRKIAEMPEGDTDFEKGLYGAAQSAPSTGVSLLVSALTKSPIAGASTMGAGVAGAAYGEAEDAGKDWVSRMRYAITQGAIETGTEFIPLKFLMGDLARDTPFTKMFFRNVVSEGLTEQAATFLQDASSWLELNPDKTLGEFLAERPSAAIQTLVASTLMSSVQTSAVKAVDTGLQKVNEGYQQKRAEEIANMVRAMGDKAADSKLLKRMPDKYREAVAAVTKDGPLENIRIDADGINALAQDGKVTLEQLERAFHVEPGSIQSAIDTGDDVIVPSGNYAAVIQTAKKDIGVSGEIIHQALAPHIKFNDQDLTPAQAEAYNEEIRASVEAARAEGGAVFAEAEDRLRNTIQEQIKALGRFDENVVQTYAEERAAKAVTMAYRMSQATGEPIDVEKFYAETFAPIRVASSWTEMGEADEGLPQVGDREAIEVDDATVQRASESLTEYEFAIWKSVTLEGRSNQHIADDPNIAELRERLTAEQRDMMPSRNAVSASIAKARRLGLPAPKAQKGRPDTIKDEVRRLVMQGLSSKQIHERLGRTPEQRNSTNAQVSKIKREMRENPELANANLRASFSAQTATAPRIMTLYGTARLDSLLHEGAHEYLDILWRLSRQENANPWIVSQYAAALNWHGLHPEWDNMYDAQTGEITAEGRKFHEMFAEAYGIYFITGKAPSTQMRSVFETIRQWMFSVYKLARKNLRQVIHTDASYKYTSEKVAAKERELGRQLKNEELIEFVLPSEIREIFDRSLAVDEAINAVHSRLAKDGQQLADAMVKRLDPEGKWKPERRAKFMARVAEKYQQARDAASAELQARHIDEFLRARRSAWNAELRDHELEVQSEEDERPEARVYQHMNGVWRDTREAHIEAALAEAEAIREAELLQGRFDLDTREARAEWVAENTVDDVIPGEATDSRQYGFALSNGTNIVVQLIPQLNGETEIHWTFLSRLKDRADETGVYAKGQESFTADDVLEMMPRIAAIVETDMAKMGRDGYSFTSVRRSVRNMNARLVRLLEGTDYEIVEFPGQDDPLLIHRDADVAENGKILPRPENRGRKFEWDGTEDPEGYADAFYEKVSALEPGGPAGRSDRGRGVPQDGREAELGQERSLPMDEASRMQRAREMGFDVDTPLYHGTARSFDEFRRDGGGSHTSMEPDAREALYFTTNPAIASDYAAEAAYRTSGNGANVVPVYARLKNPLILENYTDAGDNPTYVEVLRAAKAAGHDGVIFKGTDHALTTNGARGGAAYAIFDPANVRGKWATFDPSQEGSSKLLAQTDNSRQLDAMGFYSAAQEAATRVPDNIWKLGWQAARNALAKGQDGIVPRKTEIEFLGLDGMFGDTKLRGEELKAAVLEHIAAKRLLLSENFARFDPNPQPPTKAVMLEQLSDEDLADVIGLHIPFDAEARGSFESSIGVDTSNLSLERTSQPRVSGWAFFDLIRWNGEEKEVLANGLVADLRGKIARILVNENMSKALQNTSNAAVTDVWRMRLQDRLFRGPGDIRLPGEDVPLFESVIGLPEGVPGSDYQAPRSHVGGKAKGTLVTAHGEERIDDKGQRTLFTGQVQSDMAQQAREDKADAEHHRAVRKLLTENPDAPWFGIDGVGEYRLPEPGEPQRDLILRGTLERGIASAQIAMDAPLLSTSEWTNVAVRAMVYRAARDGFASVSFPTAETSEIIQGNDDAAQHYETNVKGALEKIGKQLGGAVRKGGVEAGIERGLISADMSVLLSNYGSLAEALEFRRGQLSKWEASGNTGAQAEKIKKELRKEIVDLERMEQDANGTQLASAYILDITPEMRAKIVAEGFPLFHTGTRKGNTTPPADLPPMRLNLQTVKEQYGEKALLEIPPDVAKHSARGTDVEAYVDIARSLQKKQKKPKSLWKFLATPRKGSAVSYSGIRDPEGEILAIIDKKREAPGLIADPAKDGKASRSYDIEQAATAAWEAGYFQGESPPTPAEFLDALRGDVSGRSRIYTLEGQADIADIEKQSQWAEWFDQNGVDITADDATLSAQLAVVLTGEQTNAIGPDEAAQAFNAHFKREVFKTGRDLLDALKAGPGRAKRIREEALRRMIAEHGDIFNDGSLMREAEAYARNEVQMRQFEIELAALAQVAGRQSESALAKAHAIEALRTKQVREVLNYNQWLTLERRWSAKALAAAQAGDMDKAAEYGRLRLIQSHMYVEGKKLAEDIEKAVKHAKSFEKKDKRIRIGKAGPDYLQQIDQILEGYEFKPVTRKREQERVELRDWFAAKQAAMDPMFDPTGLSEEEMMAVELERAERSAALAAMQSDANVRNYKSITTEELMAVRDQLDMIERTARRANALLVEDERRHINLAIDDIEAQAIIATPKELPPESYASYSPKEKQKRGIKQFFSEIRTMQAIVRIIDGIDNGPLAKNTIHKLNTAGAMRQARMKLEEERVVALFREAYGINLDVLRKDQMRFPGIDVPLAKMERLTIALYWGTEISRKRIMDGYGWDAATVQNVLNSLDQTDWNFVKSVWDYVGSLYPEHSEAHQDIHGVPIGKQPGLPIVTRYGVIDGSYFPIRYNPYQSSRADQQALTDTAKQITGRAGTRKATGSTKERVKGKVTMPVLLDLYHTLAFHVNEVVDNITMQRAVLDAGRIIAHPRTQQIIVKRHGWVTYKTLMSAMKDTRNGLAAPNGPTEQIATRIRNGATNVTLGLNIGTVIKQLIGFTATSVRLGGPRTGAIGGLGWMLRGAVRMGFGARGMQNGVAFILERSPYMRVRMQIMNQAIADQQRRINEGNIKADLKRGIDIASFFMIQRVQFLAIDSPTWLGAFEKFTASGMSEKDAAASADQIVIDSQGSGELWQVSAFQRGGPIQRIFTNYITAAIANWNLAANQTRQTNFRNPGQVAIWAMNMGVLMTVPVILSMAVAHMMSPGGDDDDEPLEEQYIREQISFLLGPLGLFGQMSGAAAGFAYKGPQGTRWFQEASKVITETFTGAEKLFAGEATADDAIDILRPANMAAGVWLGYPAAALDRFVRGAWALAEGDTQDPKALLAGPPRE